MPPPHEHRLTAIFTKRPEPGRVKTRLCPPLEPAQAAELAEAMLRDTVARCRAGAFRTALVFAPAEAAGWFRACFPELADQRPQVGEGLGARLAHFVEDSFRRGEARTVVVIGSDQPLVPPSCLEAAHRALEEGADCVLGPDLGGGYYLVGLTRSVPRLFTDVTMSSADMCRATEALARSIGLEVARLEPHPDVDLPSDLARLRGALDEMPPGGEDHLEHTRRALSALPPTSLRAP